MGRSSNTSPIRKAAVLIRSLDADSAARLLAQLGPEEARALREAMRGLGAVGEEEISRVAAELQRRPMPAPSLTEQANAAVVLELSGEVTADKRPSADSPPRSERFNSQLADLRQLAASAHNPALPFRSLVATDTQSLADFLKQEHPQTVAVVLSYLPVEKAAEALSGLTEGRQAEVVQRLAELGDTDADSLRVVEHSLEVWLADQRREQLRRTDRMSIVGSILAATPDRTLQVILSHVQKRDRRLARQIEVQVTKSAARVSGGGSTRTNECQGSFHKNNNANEAYNTERPPAPSRARTIDFACDENASPDALLAFDDLVELPKQVLTTLLRTTDSQVLYCAFAGASEQLLERISGALPRRQRKGFREQLRSLGPIRLRDVETAQRAVAQTASRITGVSQVKYAVRQAA